MNNALAYLSNQLSAEGLADYIKLLERTVDPNNSNATGATGATGSAGHIGAVSKNNSPRLDAFIAEQKAHWTRVMSELELPEHPHPDAFLQAIHTRTTALNTAVQEQLQLQDVSSAEGWEQLITHIQAKLPADVFTGYFVKPEVIANQLRAHPPQATLTYLGYDTIDTALQQESVFELMAALRFSESEDWMEGFLQTYQQLQPSDFAERPVEFLILDPEKWWKLAEPFATKKKHHFSHLKELGVVFSYPAPFQSNEQTSSGSLHVYIAMILHYIFEVRFYSDFFRANIHANIHRVENFGQAFVEILKGDTNMCASNTYQLPIIQQYHLKKPHPNPCVFRPHVMPEVLHWHKARRALLQLVTDHPQRPLFEFWDSCYTVGSVQPDLPGGHDGTLLTLNFADNILSHQEVLSYHYKEDLWNRMFTLYFSEEELEQAIIQHFAAKVIDIRELSQNIN